MYLFQDFWLTLLFALQLCGFGLPKADLNGFADPFLRLSSSVFEQSIHDTKPQFKTLNPVWPEEVSIPLAANSRSLLEHRHVNVKVMDVDRSTKVTLMAAGVLHLAPALSGDKVNFSIILHRGGLPAGEIRGRFWLTIGHGTGERMTPEQVAQRVSVVSLANYV